MTKPLSLDLRQRVIGAIDGGLSCRAAAKRFGIARSAVVKWRRIWLDTGSIAPRAQGGDTRSGRIEAVGPAILGMVAEAPGLTLVEIAERLAADGSVLVKLDESAVKGLAQRIINSSFNSSIGCSPAALLFGENVDLEVFAE